MKKGILVLVVFLIVVGIVGVSIFLNSNNKIEKVSKIFNDKDLVYDANYEKNVTKEFYTTRFNETYYAKDIVVPYINIKSDYAEKANAQIKEVFDTAIKTFNDGVENAKEFPESPAIYVDVCNYTKYENDKVLSVVLKYGEGSTSITYPDYYRYNINLETGEEMSLEEICKVLGYDFNTLDSKVEEATTKKLIEIFKDSRYYDFDTFNNDTIEYYRNSNDRNSRYFINEDGKLCIIVTLQIPFEGGHQESVVEVALD